MSSNSKKLDTYPVTADCLVMSAYSNQLFILLVKRDQTPYRGKWAIPGGFITKHETAKQTALRKLREETNLCDVNIEQIHAFSSIDRDPRDRVITIAYLSLVPFEDLNFSTGQRSQDARLFSIDIMDNHLVMKSSDLTVLENELAFDHAEIIKYAIRFIQMIHK